MFSDRATIHNYGPGSFKLHKCGGKTNKNWKSTTSFLIFKFSDYLIQNFCEKEKKVFNATMFEMTMLCKNLIAGKWPKTFPASVQVYRNYCKISK